MIENAELEFPRIETVIDSLGEVRRFTVEMTSTDGGYFLRAAEEGIERGGYEFAAHSETSARLAMNKLRERIRKGVTTRYLASEWGRRQLSHDVAVGTIGYGCVVIDGEEVPFHELEEILQVYEGFQFSLKIADPYDTL